MSQPKTYFEQLPPACPPTHAIDRQFGPVYRLVSTDRPQAESFASHAAMGKPKPLGKKISDCEWASCSLFTKMEAIRDLLKLANIRKRYSYVATLKICNGSGKHVLNGAHVDFWRYANFDISAAIEVVEGV